MTREEAKAFLPILEAYSKGGMIQYLSGGEWDNINGPAFDSGPSRYRIKPEPRTFWVVENKETIHVVKDSDRAKNYAALYNCEIIEVREVIK